MDHLPEHIREQLEAQKSQCVFCRILAGEIDSKKVYDDGVLAALLDINPGVKGHTLIMPKEHYPILPLLSPGEFDRLFGLMPRFTEALTDAMIVDSTSVFIANGGAAGQQSPHFIVHLIPRERSDALFGFKRRGVDPAAIALLEGKVAQILSLMLAKHIGFEPIDGPAFLQSDAIVIERSPVEQVAGHLEIRPASGARLSELPSAASAMLFRAASLASTALFENLECEATNIIADTKGGFVIHVIPRTSEDGLEIMWTPLASPPDASEVASRVDKAFFPIQVAAEKGVFDLPRLSHPEPVPPAPAASARPVSAPLPPRAPQAHDRGSAHLGLSPDDRARIEAAWERLRRTRLP